MSYRPLARGIRAAVMNLVERSYRNSTLALRFFCRAPLDTRNACLRAGVLFLSKSARKRRENISGNGEKYLCLERPVFDTHAFFLFVGSLHTRVHKRWPNVVAKRAGRQGLTKGLLSPRVRSPTAKLLIPRPARCSQRGRKSPKRGGPLWRDLCGDYGAGLVRDTPHGSHYG